MRRAFAALGVLTLCAAVPAVAQTEAPHKYFLGLQIAEKPDAKLGFQIITVIAKSPAASSKGGFKVGEFISAVNSHPAKSWLGVRNDVQASPGGLVKLSITDPKTGKVRNVSVQMVPLKPKK